MQCSYQAVQGQQDDQQSTAAQVDMDATMPNSEVEVDVVDKIGAILTMCNSLLDDNTCGNGGVDEEDRQAEVQQQEEQDFNVHSSAESEPPGKQISITGMSSFAVHA